MHKYNESDMYKGTYIGGLYGQFSVLWILWVLWMKVMQDEFRCNDDRIKFLEMFAMTKSDNDMLAVSAVADKVRHAGLPVTALAYNRWLDAAGAKRGREMYQGKRQCVVKRIKINTDYTKPD